MTQDLLTHEKRAYLEKLLREIESIEADLLNPENHTRLAAIIDQAYSHIYTSSLGTIKTRTLDVLTQAKEYTEKYATRSDTSGYDLIEITNQAYIAIDAFLLLSYEGFQFR